MTSKLLSSAVGSLSKESDSPTLRLDHSHWPAFQSTHLGSQLVEIFDYMGYTVLETEFDAVDIYSPEQGYIKINYTGLHYLPGYFRLRRKSGAIQVVLSDGFFEQPLQNDSSMPSVGMLINCEPTVYDIYTSIIYHIRLIPMDVERPVEERHYRVLESTR